MKTIGLLGGLTWESSSEYYRLINEMIYEKLGGRHSAQLILLSVDFDPVNRLMANQEWDEVSKVITEKCLQLQDCGADCLIICCNTMHVIADKVAENLDIKLLNIIDVIAEDVKNKGMKKVGLLGSSHTMRMDFYKDRLLSKHGIKSLIPAEKDIERIMDVIEKELGNGIIKDESRNEFLRIINQMASKGAEGVILGCTEIPLLIKQSDTCVKLFDSTYLHSKSAVDFSLGK